MRPPLSSCGSHVAKAIRVIVWSHLQSSELYNILIGDGSRCRARCGPTVQSRVASAPCMASALQHVRMPHRHRPQSSSQAFALTATTDMLLLLLLLSIPSHRSLASYHSFLVINPVSVQKRHLILQQM